MGRHFSPEQKRQILSTILSMRDRGHTFADIASETGVNEMTARKWFDKAKKAAPVEVSVSLKTTPEAFMIRAIKTQLKGITEAIYDLENMLR